MHFALGRRAVWSSAGFIFFPVVAMRSLACLLYSYISYNSWMISEEILGREAEGYGCGSVRAAMAASTWITTKPSVSLTGVPDGIWTQKAFGMQVSSFVTLAHCKYSVAILHTFVPVLQSGNLAWLTFRPLFVLISVETTTVVTPDLLLFLALWTKVKEVYWGNIYHVEW
jgi:hypothetical protein